MTFDNRLLYEAVLDGPKREDGHRLRNRSRFTFNLAPEAELQPRMIAYAELVLDSRKRASRLDFAAGVGGTLASRLRTDFYVLRQIYPDRPRSNLNALVVDLQIRLGAKAQN